MGRAGVEAIECIFIQLWLPSSYLRTGAAMLSTCFRFPQVFTVISQSSSSFVLIEAVCQDGRRINGENKRREFRSCHPKTAEDEGRGGSGDDAKQIIFPERKRPLLPRDGGENRGEVAAR